MNQTQHNSSDLKSNKSSADLDISLTNEKKNLNTSFSSMMGDVLHGKPFRKRVVSHDDDIVPHKFFSHHSLPSAQAEKWKEETFATEDDRIGSFLDYLSKFQDY